MAFQARNLSVLAYANGFTLWHYTTVDAAAVVDTGGYFDAAAEMLRVGDIVIANVDTDATPRCRPVPDQVERRRHGRRRRHDRDRRERHRLEQDAER